MLEARERERERETRGIEKEREMIKEQQQQLEVNDIQMEAKTETSSIVSGDMDWEGGRPPKRKLDGPDQQDREEENEEEMGTKRKMRLRNRRRIEDKEDVQQESGTKGIRKCSSDPDLSRMKNKEEEVTTDKEKEVAKKIGRPKKRTKAIDANEAEDMILSKIGSAPENIESELFKSMTASDISAQALEYLSDVEVIRAKSGRMQGGLSGELKKRIKGLESIIRVLQNKAESAGDPEFLRMKITELLEEIKKGKREEEKRRREISEMRDIIQELRQENRSMREEIRKIRDSVEKKSRKEKNEDLDEKREKGKSEERKKMKRQITPVICTPDFHLPDEMEVDVSESHDERQEDEKSADAKSTDEILPPVRRPTLGGKSTLIPENLKQKDRKSIVSRQIEALIKIRNKICRDDEEGKEKEVDKSNGRGNTGLRIKENIQVLPPYSERKERDLSGEKMIGKEDRVTESEMQRSDYKMDGEGWQEVRKNKGRKSGKESRNPQIPEPPPTRKEMEGKTLGKKRSKVPKRKTPKTEAISIKGKIGQFSYAEALKKARKAISLDTLKIEAPKIRKGINGSTIIELSGENKAEKADMLARKLQEVLSEEAYVYRPVIKGELKITGFDESVTSEEICWAVATDGDCKLQDVRAGVIRRTRNGLGVVWIKCPLETANKIAKNSKIKVGWTIAKAELLPNRPMQCFRCWRVGHARDVCQSKDDFSKCCYRCSAEGHTLSQRVDDKWILCTNKPWCILCARLKKEANHRVGSARCEGARMRSYGSKAYENQVQRKDTEIREMKAIHKEKSRSEECMMEM